MAQPQSRRLVSWGSAGLGLIGVGVAVYDGFIGTALPLWDILLISYGGAFLVVLPMNWIGQQAAQFRSDKDTLPKRPNVRPSPAGPKVALEGSYVRQSEVRLERATADTAAKFRTLLEEAVTELAALQNRLPDLDANGGVMAQGLEGALEAPGWHPFFICHREDVIGLCIAKSEDTGLRLALLYVESPWRRRRIGTEAMNRLLDFARMIGLGAHILAAVSTDNARGQRFLRDVGFVSDQKVGTGAPQTPDIHLVLQPEDARLPHR